MALSQQRLGEIALIVVQEVLNDKGIRLVPNEIKVQLTDNCEKYGITPQEGAEFAQVFITAAYDKTMAELESMKTKK